MNGFGKEVRRVEVRGYKGYLDLKGLDHVAYVKVASGNVLHSVVVLGVVGNVAGALAVCAEASRAGERCIDAGDEFAMVDHVLDVVEGCRVSMSRLSSYVECAIELENGM